MFAVALLACWYVRTGIPDKGRTMGNPSIIRAPGRLTIDSNTAFSIINANTNDSHYTQIRVVSKEYLEISLFTHRQPLSSVTRRSPSKHGAGALGATFGSNIRPRTRLDRNPSRVPGGRTISPGASFGDGELISVPYLSFAVGQTVQTLRKWFQRCSLQRGF
jgi:hypothetical protein